jgi:hypothetical protein
VWSTRVAQRFLPLVLAALVAGCDGSGKRPESTLPPPPPSTTTTTIDVTKVPATIDVAYVQAVMNSLDKVTGDAVRVFVAQRGPNKEWYETFRAVFEEDVFQRLQKEFSDFVILDQLTSLRSQPGNPMTTVMRIVDSSPTCIVVEGNRTFGPIFVTPPPSDTISGFVQLALKQPERDPQGRNSTTWSIVADVNSQEAKVPENPCV